MNIIIPKKVLGDCRQGLRAMPENSVHCCVSSPPWAMRRYLADGHPLKHLEIGNESTIEEYLAHIVEVFTEARRVLREDGLLWVNIGDRYSSGGRRTYDKNGRSGTAQVANHPAAGIMRPEDPAGIKRKDLLMLPSRVAMALQASGWYLRSQIPWVKRNPLPESADDRPGVAVEYFFMFSKSEHYFYDQQSVKIAASENTHPRSAAAKAFPSTRERDDNRRRVTPKEGKNDPGNRNNTSFASSMSDMVSSRNRRNSDWFMESFQGLLTDDEEQPMALLVNTKGTTLEHFASYPPKLIEPIIRCSTSDGGCCPKCGTNLKRITHDEGPDLEHQRACGGDKHGEYDGEATKGFNEHGVQNASDVKRRILAGMRKKKTVGYQTQCSCFGQVAVAVNSAGGSFFNPAPCHVVDPFHGVGTTAKVATQLGRQYTGFEISEQYFKDSDVNDSQTAMHLV